LLTPQLTTFFAFDFQKLFFFLVDRTVKPSGGRKVFR